MSGIRGVSQLAECFPGMYEASGQHKAGTAACTCNYSLWEVGKADQKFTVLLGHSVSSKLAWYILRICPKKKRKKEEERRGKERRGERRERGRGRGKGRGRGEKGRGGEGGGGKGRGKRGGKQIKLSVY